MNKILLLFMTLAIISCNQGGGGESGYYSVYVYPDNTLSVGDGTRIVKPKGIVCHHDSGSIVVNSFCPLFNLDVAPKIEQKSPAGNIEITVYGATTATVPLAIAEGQKLSSVTENDRVNSIREHIICRADHIKSGAFCLPRNAHLVHGNRSSCAIQPDYTVVCWGRFNEDGQLGKGFYDTDSDINNLVPSLTVEHDLKLKALTSSQRAFCGIDLQDEIVCWGDIEPLTGLHITSSPQRISNGLKVKSISISLHAMCVIDMNDNILCAGRNDFGQLGSGDTNPNYILSPVTGNLKAKKVELGMEFACAHLMNNQLSCWGSGANGKLGTENNLASLVPISHSTPIEIKQLSVGQTHACVIRANELPACFGENSLGQLATGDDLPSSSISSMPTFVYHVTDVKKIIAGHWSTCIETNDSEFFCVGGENTNYGVNETGPSLVLRQVFAGQGVQSIYPTRTHILGRLNNGRTIIRGRDVGDGTLGLSTADNVIPFNYLPL